MDSKGIDLENNRFLILQGEVEMISMMPPKGKDNNDDGLLEYLEDIIGSNKYVEDADKAMVIVETLTESRQEKLNRVKAVEKEKEVLEGGKLEAEQYMGKESQLRKKKNVLYQMNMLEVDEERGETQEQFDVYNERMTTQRATLSVSEERLAAIETEHASHVTNFESLNSELKVVKEEFAAYERRDIKLREDIKHVKATQKKLDAKIKTETAKAKDIIAAGKAAEKSIPALEKAVVTTEASKKTQETSLAGIYEEMKGVTESLRKDLESKNAELAPVLEERSTFQAALDTASTEVNLLEDTSARSQKQLEKAEQELANLDAHEAKKTSELETARGDLETSKERLSLSKKEAASLEQQEASLQKKHSEYTARSEEAKAALQNSSGKLSDSVKGILRAGKKGGELADAGIKGRLGDLASISNEYDVAISTACGMLDNIVVETTAGAQMCLKFLRKHGLGRANFIPLDKMKKGAYNQPVQTPEDAPRLFDLVTPTDESILPALFLGINNTLVAPDMETATRWAYNYGRRWRVVTLDGQMIETSGTMAGGGNKSKVGGMRLASGGKRNGVVAMEEDNDEENDSAELEKLAQGAMEEYKACRQRRRELSEEVRQRSSASALVQAPAYTCPPYSPVSRCRSTRSRRRSRV